MGSCGQAEFSSGNSFKALGVRRLWSCLPALLIIHHFWLPSWRLVGRVWFGMGDSYLQSLGQDVPILMNHMQPWCLAKVGPEQPGQDLKWGSLSPCMPLATSHCCGLSAAVLSPPLATGNQLPEMAKRWREMWWSGDDWCLLVPQCPLCPLDRQL